MSHQPPLSEQERADLVAYLDGELPEGAAQRIEVSLSLDPRVRTEADALKKTWDLLDFLPRAEPSSLFTSRTLERLTAPATQPAALPGSRRWRHWALGLGWAASLMLATYTGFSLFSRGTAPREPADLELVQDLRLFENKRLYDLIDDLEFLHELDHPDLFGDETKGS